jgi:predicted DNA-binding protein
MADSKAVSIRIPDELLAKIDDLAERKYRSIKGKPNRSLVILDALVAHFDKLPDTKNSNNAITLNDTVTIQDFQELQNLVNRMIGEIEQLKKTVTTVSDSADETNVVNAGQKGNDQLELVQIIKSTVSDTVVTESSSDDGLTVNQLAERLGKKRGDITSKKFNCNRKSEPEKFIEWSRNLDPEGQGWEFREGSKLFYRVEIASLSDS